MTDYKKMLTPISEEMPPPKHTQLYPRCFTCRHFPVCEIKTDYLKTLTLIEEILGSPCENYELCPLPVLVPEFKGQIIVEHQEYFPEKVASINEKEGTFYAAKYTDEKNIQFIYIFEGYYVLFGAVFNEETQEFDISKGREICYNLKCQLSETSLGDLYFGLLSFKEDQENKELQEEEKDIINTTHFSAALECDFYEWEKGLDYYKGMKRILSKYPDGVPLSDGTYYHIATFHCEDEKVPCYTPPNCGYIGIPYPVFIPPKCEKKRPPTRDELNEF